MIESTLDMEQVENHEFMIKPEFDEMLACKLSKISDELMQKILYLQNKILLRFIQLTTSFQNRV